MNKSPVGALIAFNKANDKKTRLILKPLKIKSREYFPALNLKPIYNLNHAINLRLRSAMPDNAAPSSIIVLPPSGVLTDWEWKDKLSVNVVVPLADGS